MVGRVAVDGVLGLEDGVGHDGGLRELIADHPSQLGFFQASGWREVVADSAGGAHRDIVTPDALRGNASGNAMDQFVNQTRLLSVEHTGVNTDQSVFFSSVD